jgi:small subunit ribosomal protein S17
MTTIKTRGRTFTGIVISDKMSKTATVRWERKQFLPKYERYQKRKTVVKAHIPDGMIVHTGDMVTITETRPLSKTKHFLIITNHTREQSITNTVNDKPLVNETTRDENSNIPVKKTTKKVVKKTTKKTIKKTTEQQE